MSENFVMCVRDVKDGYFIPEPGLSSFLCVPEGENPSPVHKINPEEWVRKLMIASSWGKDSRGTGYDRGDLLIFIHGYNNDQKTVMERHALLKKGLGAAGFRGEILSFDWPSADSAINYLEDRHDAKKTAMQLVSDGISLLSERQRRGCVVNIHILAHSMGAYVVREAFDDADDAHLMNNSWMTSQIAFIAGDVSSGSLSLNNPSSESLYRHCARLTNYSNGNDSVLKLSNVKRIGIAPRAGRAGLPENIPTNAVNVECTDYFSKLETDEQIRNRDQTPVCGSFDHAWYFGNRIFIRDLFETLKGDSGRTSIPTRKVDENRKIVMLS